MKCTFFVFHKMTHLCMAFLKAQLSGQRARNLGLCVLSLTSDLKPWEVTIRTSPSSWLAALSVTYKAPTQFAKEKAGLAWLLFVKGLTKVDTWEMQTVVITMQTVDVKGWSGIFAFLIRAGLFFPPANLGTLLLLMTFLDPCPGLRDIVFRSR